ncbi:MAG: hypothetical protein ACRDRI_05520 [Pseudonocardiaceae bacterium]
MSTSTRELTDSTSAETAQPADSPTAKAAGEIHQGKETVQATVDEVKQHLRKGVAAVALGVLGVSMVLRRVRRRSR